jgi:hypothetical protein
MRSDIGNAPGSGGYDPEAFGWYGLGMLWALDYTPWAPEGGRIFWCPGEQRGQYNGAVSGGWYGPGYYWNPANGQIGKYRTACAGNNAGMMTGSYAYRSLGSNTIASTLNNNNYDISFLGDRVAVIDGCEYVDGSGGPFQRNYGFTHGNYKYMGFNRLWYDGHAKWYDDQGAIPSWLVGTGSTQALGNYYNQACWNKYDANR